MESNQVLTNENVVMKIPGDSNDVTKMTISKYITIKSSNLQFHFKEYYEIVYERKPALYCDCTYHIDADFFYRNASTQNTKQSFKFQSDLRSNCFTV